MLSLILIALLVGALTFQPAPPGSEPTPPPPPPAPGTLPELPRVYLDTTYTAPTGPTINVPAGGDLQAALNNAQPGSTLVLQAGATYVGNFTLPNKSGTGWIYIQSSALASLPPPGTRVTPVQAPLMPKLVGPAGSSTIRTAPGAHHFRFIGLEIMPAAGAYGDVVLLGVYGGTTASALPHDIVFDRSFVHGDPLVGAHNGITMNGNAIAVVDSYISDAKATSQETHGLTSFNAYGPFKIVNNFIEAAGSNLFFGGATPGIPGMVMSDIEVRNNYFFKPLSWRPGDPAYAGTPWVVKNLFEAKSAVRVLMDGNVFENNWNGSFESQGGQAIVLTPRAGDGGAGVVKDFTFTNNIVRRSTAGAQMWGEDTATQSEKLQRVLVRNNLWIDIGAFPDVAYGGYFRGMLFYTNSPPGGGFVDVIIDHNTALQTGDFYGVNIQGGSASYTGFVWTNNIISNGRNGMNGDTLATLSAYFPGYLVIRNAVVSGTAWPPDNFFPSSYDVVGFVNLAGGDYHLAPTSLFKNAGTDGKDLGADIDAIDAATAGSVTGSPAQVAAQATPLAPAKTATTVGGPAGGAAAGATVTMNATVGTVQTPTFPVATADIAPLLISSVTVAFVTSSEAAITWATNEASDSRAEYGPTTGYGTVSQVDTRMVTAHALILSGLTTGTTYHFRVKSRDAAGNLTASSDFTLTTAPAEP